MKLIILGGGGHAKVLYDSLCQSSSHEILGYTDLKSTALKLSYLGDDSSIEMYLSKDFLLVNGIGSTDVSSHRQRLFENFKKKGYRFYSVIHPKTIVASDVDLSEGVQLMAGVIIQPGTVIGQNTIINTGATIDHDCKIGAHSHIAPGVTLSGGVQIGIGCHIGTGATLIQGVTIGDFSCVGAGAVVTKSLPSYVKAYGVPAQIRS